MCERSTCVPRAGGGSDRKPAGETRGELLPSAPAHDIHAEFAAHGKPATGAGEPSPGAGISQDVREQVVRASSCARSATCAGNLIDLRSFVPKKPVCHDLGIFLPPANAHAYASYDMLVLKPVPSRSHSKSSESQGSDPLQHFKRMIVHTLHQVPSINPPLSF